jgi:hypothetical protein
MLRIEKKALTLEPQDVMELERIMTDEDREGAYQFVKKNIYRRLTGSEEDRLKSHLDGCGDPAGSFAKNE